MRSAPGVAARLSSVLARVFVDALLPIAVALLLVTFLADPARINTNELRANSTLMNTRQLFRDDANPFVAAVGSSAILMLTAIAGAIAVASRRGRIRGRAIASSSRSRGR